MNPVSEDIKDLLVKLRQGVFASTKEQEWGIYIAEQPSSPTNVITILDGEILLHKKYSGSPDEEALFSISVRSSSYLTAREKLVLIQGALDRIGFLTINKAAYINILTDGGPIYLGKDETFRHTWTQNFKAFRKAA